MPRIARKLKLRGIAGYKGTFKQAVLGSHVCPSGVPYLRPAPPALVFLGLDCFQLP